MYAYGDSREENNLVNTIFPLSKGRSYLYGKSLSKYDCLRQPWCGLKKCFREQATPVLTNSQVRLIIFVRERRSTSDIYPTVLNQGYLRQLLH